MDRIDQLRLRLLVVKCQIGQRPAWEELYRRFNPAIGYYLRRLIGEEQAADVQQEVWLTVMRNIARLSAPEAFVVWLYRIARSKAMSRVHYRLCVRFLRTIVGQGSRQGYIFAAHPP